MPVISLLQQENSIVQEEVLNANQVYSKFFGSKAELPLSSTIKFAILTCMDARLDPAR